MLIVEIRQYGFEGQWLVRVEQLLDTPLQLLPEIIDILLLGEGILQPLVAEVISLHSPNDHHIL